MSLERDDGSEVYRNVFVSISFGDLMSLEPPDHPTDPQPIHYWVSISFGDLMSLERRSSEPAPRGHSNHDLRVNCL